MSINAINSVSIYEYYYTIDSKKKKKSPLADEMKKYGLTPTEDETVNIILLERAKKAQAAAKDDNETKESSKADRPWADIMYQLNLSFNENPLDDIKDIKNELQDLLKGIKDEELEKETKDLESYVEKLYIDYSKNNLSGSLLTSQLENLSAINRMNFT